MSSMTRSEKQKTMANGREIPRDERLPGLSALLDAGRVRELLTPHTVGAFEHVEDCRIAYVRYKPQTSCVVTYALRCAGLDGEPVEQLLYGKCYTEGDFANAARKAASQQWVQTSNMEPVITLPDLCAIIYVYPNDRELAGLRVIAHPKKMQRMLYEYLTDYPGGEWRISDKRLRATTVRYKPEKRAVVRFDTRATHRQSGAREDVCVYLRAYADRRGEALFTLMEKLHERFYNHEALQVPRPLAYFADKGLLFIEGLAGEPMVAGLAGPRSVDRVAGTAKAIATLHGFQDGDLETRTAATLMDDARSTAVTLGHVAPETGVQVNELLAALQASRPGDPEGGMCFVHGDFYHGQVLLQNGGQAILDFDRSYVGDPLADIGNFCAHLRLLVLQNRISDWTPLHDAFVGAYAEAAGQPDSGRLKFWTALGLFQLSVGPFRSLQAEWRTKSESILNECRSVLK
jgi:aminoglycoside phosphotransferase (APT) family kinase protein